MANVNLPRGPLYDPKCKVRNFKFAEDFENIRLNLVGTGALFEDPDFFYYLDLDLEWKRPHDIVDRPMFINGLPSRFDALQGNLKDCWAVSAFDAITLHDDLIAHVVPMDQSFEHDYIGAFHFRFWQLGTWYDVVVDDRIPVKKNDNKLKYLHSKRGDVFWAVLLEKAYAKFYGTDYMAIISESNMMALQDLSGGIVERIYLRNNSFTQTIPDIKWFLHKVFMKDGLMLGSMRDNVMGLRSDHSYSVTSILKCSDDDPHYHGLFIMRLFNPWGHTEWKGDWNDKDEERWKTIDRETYRMLEVIPKNDGEFWMNEKDFVKYFYYLTVCHLGPGQYIASRHGEDIRTWRTTSFFGNWVKNFSAGGSNKFWRYANPQFIISLKSPENDTNSDGLCYVVIELTQRLTKKYDSKIDKRPLIAFYIYSLDMYRKDEMPIPLPRGFFYDNRPENIPDFSKSYGRAYLMRTKLRPGKYCILPCTFEKNKEARFLLRVFSESEVELWEYDTKVSKSLATEEQIPNECNKEMESLFNNIAQGQDEIDWVGLKEILGIAMNPKKSYFSVIASFFQFVWDKFETYFSLRSSVDVETGDVVFTKDECRSMVAMLDDNHSGKLSFSEFSNLWNKICFWTKVYEQHRDETEGCVTVSQLRDALGSIGYNVNKQTIHNLSFVYANEQGNICLTDFILCGVTLETVLNLCPKEDEDDGNKFTFTLEKWVKCTLIL